MLRIFIPAHLKQKPQAAVRRSNRYIFNWFASTTVDAELPEKTDYPNC
jgi:hypothetical protein